MKFQFYTAKNNCLELDVVKNRPNITICEIEVNGKFHPWYGTWNRLPLKVNTPELVEKIAKFWILDSGYPNQEFYHFLPGTSILEDDDEKWELIKCKITKVNVDSIELSFEEVRYVNKMITTSCKSK